MSLTVKLGLVFDLEKLRQHVIDYVLPLPSEQQNYAFGGWSVLSSDGSYKDGWHKGHLIYEGKTDEEISKLRQEMKIGQKKYDKPTEICHGYLQYVMDELLPIKPHRARIIRLRAGTESVWHRDTKEDDLMYRLHIPIITNEKCFYMTTQEKTHMPATGDCYIIRVNQLHRVVNYGTEDRLHLVMDAKPPTDIAQELN